MAPVLGAVVLVALVAIAIALAVRALSEVKQLRTELDETQRQVNELKAATEAVPAPPPPLPRARPKSGGLDDLREQLRAAHREDAPEQ